MRYILFLGFLLHLSASYAQVIRCSTMDMTEVEKENLTRFEKSIAQVLDKKKAQNSTNAHIINGVYTIPVVFHVVHNGESVGTGYNISYNRLLDQLKVLNDDYRKKAGTTGYNTHPAGADTKIEFCLARRRPDGSAFPNSEDGVNRINRNTAGWGTLPYGQTTINNTVKPYTTNTQGYDATVYMNFWVVPMSGGLLGYAQFPEISLGGMDCSTQSRTTDGVVIATSAVGGFTYFDANGAPFNKGRTATHEIGHWLGLRHIWGDSNCGDDFCDDTPVHASANSNCPTHPKPNSCGTADEMFENYMDYSEDACLSIFTYDQAARMRATLESYRWSLVNSSACMPPATNDAGCVQIISPIFDICSSSTTPIVRIKNYGTATLTSVKVEYSVDGGTVATKNFTGLNVASNGFTNLTLNPITGITNGIHTITAKTTMPNGVTDPFSTYDQSNAQFTFSTGTLPIIENFEGPDFPSNYWGRENPDLDCWLWVANNQSNLIGPSGTRTTAAMLDCNSQTTNGRQDMLVTPSIDLTTATAGLLEFDLAYKRKTASSNERLQVQVSTDCGTTWQATALYDKAGGTLATTSTTLSSAYIPTSANEWRHESVSLNAFVGQTIKLRFVATNNNGNNIWLDNIKISDARPTIEFVTDSSSVTETTVSSIDCRGYQDISIPLKISVSPISNVTVTPTLSGTASVNFDYILLTPTVTFPAGSSTNQSIQIRIFDDAVVENMESIVIHFTTSVNALSGTINQHTLSIIDNESNPPTQTEVLFSENFESYAAGAPAGGWTISVITGGTNTWVFGENDVISGNRAAYITQNTTSRPFTYSNTSTSRRRLVSPAIQTTGKTGLKLSFDYIANGNDIYAGAAYDFGRLQYSTSPTGPFITLVGPADNTNTSTNLTSIFHQVTSTTNYTLTLPAACENQNTLYLAWRWDNDNSTGTNPPFMIDNVTLTHEGAVDIETALSTKDVYLSPKSMVYVLSANNKVIAKIENNSTQDFGCTTVSIDRSGTGTREYSNPGAPNYLTEKTWKITPAQNISVDSLNITLYYTAAEKTGWETATGRTWTTGKIQQTGGAISAITTTTPQANGNTNLSLSPTFAPYGTGFSVKTNLNNGFGNGNTSGGFAFGLLDTLTACDPSFGFQLSLYPNPNNGSFRIYSEQNIKANLSIFNMEGKKVFESLETEINQSTFQTQLSDGLYLLELRSGSKIWRQKLMIIQ